MFAWTQQKSADDLRRFRLKRALHFNQ